MKSYKIFILFILLSVFSFATEPNGNEIGVWIEEVGFDLNSNTLILTIKSRTGEKFEEIEKLQIGGIVITNGINEETHDVIATNEGEQIENPKVVTTWIAKVELGYNLINELIKINSGTITIDPLDGNQHAIDGEKISFEPFTPAPTGGMELKIYEKLSDIPNWENDTTSLESINITNMLENGVIVDDSGKSYIFTKGGPGSFEANPGIYVLVSSGGVKTKQLWIEKNGDGVNNGTDDDDDIDVIDISSETGVIAMKIEGFISNRKNTVTVIPISEFGVKGVPKKLNFVIDTQINTIYLENEIIGEIGDNKNIQIDLSKLIELVGVAGYSYIFTVENESKSDSEFNLDGQSYTTFMENSITSTLKWNDGIVEIPTSELIGGSKGILLFSVYDKLGHKKTFEKTYFISKQLDGITSKVSDEVKERKSKIKVVTDGNKDEFGVESNIDESNE